MPPVFPVATVPKGAPHYRDDFGDARGAGADAHKHQGNDVFAPYGAPVFAVVDGRVEMRVEGRGGVVVYLHGSDGDTYYYAHLAAWEGSDREVRAGDAIGYVGQTGNACVAGTGPLCSGRTLTDPHVHFQHGHPGANWIDPFPFLQSATHVTVDDPPAVPPAPPAPGQSPAPPTQPTPTPAPPPAPSSAPKTASKTLLAKALVRAYADKHNGAAPPEQLRYVLAQALGEGTLSSFYAGSNNVGSMHATDAFHKAHGNDAGYGMFAVRDGSPGAYYITRLSVFPSLALGARAYLDLIEHDVGNLDDEDIVDASTFAQRLYIHAYFTMGHPNRTPPKDRVEAFIAGTETDDDDSNVEDYAALIEASLPDADAALEGASAEPGDPTATTNGPPFAPIFDRLSGKIGATEDDARKALGDAADKPPQNGAAISLTEALSPDAGGQGFWIFTAGPTPAVSPTVKPTGPAEVPPRDATPAKPSRVGTVLATVAVAAAAVGIFVVTGGKAA